MPEKLYRQGVKILTCSVAIVSNQKSLLPSLPLAIEVKSLLTDFRDVAEIPFPANPDGHIRVEEVPRRLPCYHFSEGQVLFRGPFIRLGRECSDPRYSLWGNQGFLYRFTLYLLEKRHRIFNLHACALFDRARNRLYVVAGGAGSGKTIYLLSGLEKGLQLFSTETIHFTYQRGHFHWFMGSLVDNVRVETLDRYFPRFCSTLAVPASDCPWTGKVAVDLSPYRCQAESLIDPEVVILLPRIEEGRSPFQLTPITSPARAAKALFDNISEKLAQTVLLYDILPVLGLDTAKLAEARRRAVLRLVGSQRTRLIASVLSSPQDCWGELLSPRFWSRRKR